MRNYYRVTFDTTLNGDKSWAIDIRGKDQKEVKNRLKDLWTEKHKDHKKIPHMFHIAIERIEPDYVSYKTFCRTFTEEEQQEMIEKFQELVREVNSYSCRTA